MSSTITVKLAFHIIFFLIDAFASYYEHFQIPSFENRMGGKFKFLTVWCIDLQTIYFGLAVIVDLTEKMSKPVNASGRSSFQKVRDGFHSVVTFPLSMFVAITFWGIYAVDRELVFPKHLDAVFPNWLNQLVHTTIVPFIIIDKVFTFHFYPRRLNGIIWTSALALTYLIWILIIAYVDDFWVYPILEHMKAHEKTIFISICLIFFSLLYILGEFLTKFIWKTQQRSVHSQKKSKKES